MNVRRGADQIPEAVIVTTLRARYGGHHSIMTNPTDQATGRMAIPGLVQLEWRELAHKSTECRDTQHRRSRRRAEWLITAWAADGCDRNVTVNVPELGAVDIRCTANATVCRAVLAADGPRLDIIRVQTMENLVR